MIQRPIHDFECAIESAFAAKSRLLARERIYEAFAGTVAWAGELLLFELLDHPSAHLCYAWEADGQIITVLREGPVQNGWKAVRAVMRAGAG